MQRREEAGREGRGGEGHGERAWLEAITEPNSRLVTFRASKTRRPSCLTMVAVKRKQGCMRATSWGGGGGGGGWDSARGHS